MTYADILIFAKTWGMAYLVFVFLLGILVIFRPGSKSEAEKHGNIPFKEDN